jgi:hypothetical protein
MAPSLIRRLAWPLAAALALLFVVGLALTGKRPDAGIVQFKPSGLLTAFAPDDTREVRIAVGGKTWRFRREEVWQSVEAPAKVPPDTGQRIEAALRLLRNAGPLRVLTADEVAQVPRSGYALGAQSLLVRLTGPDGATFEVQFGGSNPLGSARYSRVTGVEGMPMLPAYVAQAWEQVIGEHER